jgi:hypothetical protein
MSGSPMSNRAELAAAVAAVNARFDRLPENVRESRDLDWTRIDRLLDRALLDGDRADALAAIREWKNYYLAKFEEGS